MRHLHSPFIFCVIFFGGLKFINYYLISLSFFHTFLILFEWIKQEISLLIRELHDFAVREEFLSWCTMKNVNKVTDTSMCNGFLKLFGEFLKFSFFFLILDTSNTKKVFQLLPVVPQGRHCSYWSDLGWALSPLWVRTEDLKLWPWFCWDSLWRACRGGMSDSRSKGGRYSGQGSHTWFPCELFRNILSKILTVFSTRISHVW